MGQRSSKIVGGPQLIGAIGQNRDLTRHGSKAKVKLYVVVKQQQTKQQNKVTETQLNDKLSKQGFPSASCCVVLDILPKIPKATRHGKL